MTKLTHRFVEFIPEVLEKNVLYVSLAYGTVSHQCCCGCGLEVVTPLTPTDWKLIFDGETVSLHPSIGNWNFPCRSHYWINRNQVEWAGNWSNRQIVAEQARDRVAKDRYFEGMRTERPASPEKPTAARQSSPKDRKRWWHW